MPSEFDNHTELSVFKTEVRATLAQFGGSDEEWQLRGEILVVTIAVAVTLFVLQIDGNAVTQAFDVTH